MNQPLKKYLDAQAQAIEADINEALTLCNEDPMRALRVTLIANAFLQMENKRLTQQVSTGYARSKMPAKKT
jgi:hypothetical protein